MGINNNWHNTIFYDMLYPHAFHRDNRNVICQCAVYASRYSLIFREQLKISFGPRIRT